VRRLIDTVAHTALARYLDADGSIAAPIEAHLITGIMSR
jgi:hypothetical protein